MKKMMKPKQQFNLTQQARLRVLLSAIICGAFNHAQALPMGEQVQAGNASFVRDAQSLNINQTSQQAIVNWQSFGIAANEAVRLYQPNQGSALFRVIGSDPSQIFGSLSATGSLFLINPNGVLFAPGAQVNVGSLLATTMQIGDQDFLAKRYQFNGDSNAAVINQGVIRAEDGGYLVLLGNTVENSGTLEVNNGSVVLGSAQSALLDFYGDGLVQVKLSGDALQAVVNQTGNITADGGAVQLATHARTAALNIDGVVQANSLVNRNGVIRLEGGVGSKVKVTGKLEARGNSESTQGGNVTITGEQVALLDSATVDVSGRAGGGTALIGGDYQGKNSSVQNARTTYIGSGTIINANSLKEGDGGKVVVWANDATSFSGNIGAQGGTLSGNGGFVEVSGKNTLNFDGLVNTAAVNGVTGTLLLDPSNITISTAANNNIVGSPNFTGSAATSNLNVTTLQTALATNNVVVDTTSAFASAGNITVSNAVTWASANSLELRAHNDIAVNSTINATGAGALRLIANQDNTGGGNVAIAAALTAHTGGIQISGAGVTSTAAGTINTTGLASQNGGNISINATGAVNLAGVVTANGGIAGAGTVGRNAGNISINGAGITTVALTANGSNGNGANQAGGSGGGVTLTSAGTVQTTAVNAVGGNAGTGAAVGGNSGSINISTNAGNITTGALAARNGNSTGTATGALAGSISLNNTAAAGNITLGALTATGGNNGNGGSVNANATGLLTLNGAIAANGGANVAATTQAGKNAGAIILSGNGGITTLAAATINANGGAGLGINQAGGNAGLVTLNSASTILARAINSRNGNATGIGAGGAIGGITLNGTTVTTGALTTSGSNNGNAGNINVTSTSGNMTLGAVVANGGGALANTSGRNAGMVTLNSAGSITATTFAANGSAGNGASQAGGNGRDITLTAAGAITAATTTASGGNAGATGNANGGNAGNITLDAGGATPNINLGGNISAIGGTRRGTGTAGTGGAFWAKDATTNTANVTVNTAGGTVGGAGGNIRFDGALNENATARILTLTAGTGAVTLAGGAPTNALTTLTSTGASNTLGSVQTKGAQTYTGATNLNGALATLGTAGADVVTFNSPVTLTGNSSVTTAGGASDNITVGQTINGNFNLALNAGALGNVATNAVIGGTTALNAFSATGAAVTFGRSVTASSILGRSTTGNITLNNVATVLTGSGTGNAVELVAGGAASRFVNNVGAGALNASSGAGRFLVWSQNPASDTRSGLAYNFKQYNATYGLTTVADTNPNNNGFLYTTAPILNATISGVTKQYNGTVAATLGAANYSAITGTIDGDAVVASALPTIGTYDTANAGTGKTVNVTGTANGTNGVATVYGYQVGVASAGGTITAAPITVSTSNVTKTYDGTTSAVGTATLTSGTLFNNASNSGALDSLSGGIFAYTNKDFGIGNKTVTVGGVAVNDGNGGGNYNVTLADNTTSTINKANLTLNAVTDTRTYNGLTSSVGVVTPGGLQAGDSLTGLTQSFDSRNAGSRTLSVDAGFALNDGNGGNNYNVTTNTAAGTITQRAISVTSSTDTKTYDGNTISAIAPTVTVGSIVAGDTATFSQTFDNKNAGTGKMLMATGNINDGNSGNNYAVTFVADNTGVINPRAITVTAAGQNKIAGSADPLPFTFTVGGLGLVGGDTLSGTLNRIAGETVGSYAINQGSLDAGSNYALSYIGNNFTILAPSVSPRNAAGLVDLNPMLGNYTNQQLFVLNVGFTAAGNDSTGNQEACEGDPESLAKDKDFILMLNYGLNLPKGLNTSCDKASI